jgi:hypothetical protein
MKEKEKKERAKRRNFLNKNPTENRKFISPLPNLDGD